MPSGAGGSEVEGGGCRVVLMKWGKVSCYRDEAGKGADWGLGGGRWRRVQGVDDVV